MKNATDQFALPLDWPQAGDDRRFIVSGANRAAFEHFRSWSLWPVKATMFTGPRRSGRSLLARAFVARVGGRLFDGAENCDEEELFHAWNAAQDSGKPMIMVVDEVPPAWEIGLPDLRTRLAITPIARIEQPDDALFRSI
jgi:chromosomal replication initiation ATPase DnaA